MVWSDIIVAVILAFSLLAGIKGGAVIGFFSLLTLIITIPVAGTFYGFVASYLSFLPGVDWRNFLGFIITIVVVSIILSLIFWLPSHFIKSAWNSGCFFHLLGGIFTLANSAIGLTVLVFLFQAYPVIPWLNNLFAKSIILTWLVGHLDFVRYLLFEVFHSTMPTY